MEENTEAEQRKNIRAQARRRAALEEKKRKRRFVDRIILLCLIVCLGVTVMALTEYRRLDTVMGADVLGVIYAIWGGELLLIVVRQVLGSDITKRNNDEDGGV